MHAYIPEGLTPKSPSDSKALAASIARPSGLRQLSLLGNDIMRIE